MTYYCPQCKAEIVEQLDIYVSTDGTVCCWKCGTPILIELPKKEPKKEALRYNNNKLDCTHIHPAMLIYLLRIGSKGGKIYSKGNYLKGGKPSTEYINSAFRHLLKIMSGEWLDPDTKEPHGAHAAWNLLMLCWAVSSGLSTFENLDTKDPQLFIELFKEDYEHVVPKNS